MTKKELKQKLKNIPKDKIVYQRYEGIISKYIVRDNFYINVETGIAIEINENALLGKIEENIIDLIEVGDYVNGRKVIKTGRYNSDYPAFMVGETYIELECDEVWICTQETIRSIVTKEQFKSVEYNIGE